MSCLVEAIDLNGKMRNTKLSSDFHQRFVFDNLYYKLFFLLRILFYFKV